MKIIIGSTSELDPSQVKKYNLGVLEFPILMNGKVYEQNFFMPNRREQEEVFIEMLRDKENHASTVGLSENDFLKVFNQYKDEEMLVILESLESTHATRDAVRKVVKEHPEYDVKVFDCMSLTTGEGVQILALLQELEKKDLSREEALVILEKNQKTHM